MYACVSFVCQMMGKKHCGSFYTNSTRENGIVEFLDYQLPSTQANNTVKTFLRASCRSVGMVEFRSRIFNLTFAVYLVPYKSPSSC